LPLFVFGELLSIAGIALLSTRKHDTEEQIRRYEDQTNALNETRLYVTQSVGGIVRSLSVDADASNLVRQRLRSAPPLSFMNMSPSDNAEYDSERGTRSALHYAVLPGDQLSATSSAIGSVDNNKHSSHPDVFIPRANTT